MRPFGNRISCFGFVQIISAQILGESSAPKMHPDSGLGWRPSGSALSPSPQVRYRTSHWGRFPAVPVDGLRIVFAAGSRDRAIQPTRQGRSTHKRLRIAADLCGDIAESEIHGLARAPAIRHHFVNRIASTFSLNTTSNITQAINRVRTMFNDWPTRYRINGLPPLKY